MKKVLLIDDETVTHKFVQHALGKDFQLVSCYSLAEAEKVVESDLELSVALVDRQLPDGDGLSFCDKLRKHQRYQNIPIIIVSGLNSESDKLSGFFVGADDYVAKPFSPLELKARILARLRNTQSTILRIANVEIDLEAHRAHVNIGGRESEVALTRIEFKLLVALVQSNDKVLSRDMMLNKVWGDDTHVTDRVVDSHISHLRKKLAGTGVQLESLRGEGYRLSVRPSKTQAA